MGFLVGKDGRLLELGVDQQAMQLLLNLAAEWSNIRNQLTDYDLRDVPDLLQRAGELGESAGDVLERAGIDAGALVDLSNRLKTSWGEDLDDTSRLLLTPLGQIPMEDATAQPGVVSWSLLSLDASRVGNVLEGNLGFSLGGEAGALLELEANDRLELSQPDLEEGDYLLRLAFSGRALGRAGIDLRQGPAGVGFKGSLASRRALSYWFDIPGDARHELYAEAVASRLVDLPNPFKLGSIKTAIREQALERILLSGDLALSSQFNMDFRIGQVGIPYVESGSFTFSASLQRERQYQLEILATHDQGVRVNLVRKQVAASEQRNALKLGIDMSAVVKQVRSYLQKGHPKYKAFMQEYGEYLSPGTWLKRKLRSEYDAAVSDLAEELNRGTAQLGKYLEQELNGMVSLVDASASEASTQLADRLADRLGGLVSREQIAALVPKLEQKLDAVIRDLDASLQKTLREKLEEGGDRALKKIEQYKVAFEAESAPLAGAADEALADLRGALLRAGEVTATISRSLLQAADTRLSLRLLHEESEQQREDLDLWVEFSTVDRAAETVYDKLLSGGMDDILQLVDTGEVNGEYSSGLARISRDATEIGFLGIDLSESNFFRSDMEVRVDSDGNIVAGASMRVEHSLRSFRESQTVGYMSHFNLWGARESGSGSIGLTVRQKDDNLEAEELRDFLDELVHFGLLRRTTMERALAELASRRSGQQQSATVEARLVLDEESLQALLDNREDRDVQAYIDTLTNTLATVGVYASDTIEDAGRKVLGLRPYRSHRREPAAFAWQVFQPLPQRRPRYQRKWQWFASEEFALTSSARRYPTTSDTHFRIKQAEQVHYLLKSYWVLLEKMDTLSRYSPSKPRGKKAIEKMQKEIDQVHEEMAFCLAPWLRAARKFIFHPKDEFARRTLAFFYQLARDAGLDREAGVMSISLKFEGDERPVRFM